MKKQIFAAVLCSSLSLPSFAAGVYVFGAFERNKAEADIEGFTLSETDNGYGFGLGYQINNTLAVEFAYRDMLSLSSGESYEDFEYRENVDITALQLSMLARYPLNKKVNVYGRLGVGKVEIDSEYREIDWGGTYIESSSESKNKAVFGVGGSYAFTEQLGARLEYNQFAKIEETTLSSISLALTYNF
jgi:OOP family OmpA-OmpF porin